MDYIFGTVTRNGVTVENLKTVGDTHTDLDGFRQTVREYPDGAITDNFRVVEKYHTDDDAEGNCYDWYEIDRHYRVVDKSGPLKHQAEENSMVIEDAICELDAAAEARLADVEAAICELDAIINGGDLQ